MDLRNVRGRISMRAFDIVNARLIGFFPPAVWPQFVSEMLRIANPGGIIRLTETEMSFTNSPALEQWHAWFFESFRRAGHSFSSDGHRLDTTAMLAPFLRSSWMQEYPDQSLRHRVVVRGRGL